MIYKGTNDVISDICMIMDYRDECIFSKYSIWIINGLDDENDFYG